MVKLCRYLVASAIALPVCSLAATFEDPENDNALLFGSDITVISALYDDQNVYLSATFRDGTFDSAFGGLSFGINSDNRQDTGGQIIPGIERPTFVGAEFMLFYNGPYSSTDTPNGFFRVLRYTGSGSDTVVLGAAKPMFSQDVAQIVVPRYVVDGASSFGIGADAGLRVLGDPTRYWVADYTGTQNNKFIGAASFGTPSWAYSPIFLPVPDAPTQAQMLLGLLALLSLYSLNQRTRSSF